MTDKRIVLGGTFIIVCMISSSVFAQIREYADPSLPVISVASLDANGIPIVRYNPIRCQQLGPALCTYFKYHEYGHIKMRHFLRGTPHNRAEAEADCWAARNAPAYAVNAAQSYFASGRGGGPRHGSAASRVLRIQNCRR